jgi:hypothetical protein
VTNSQKAQVAFAVLLLGLVFVLFLVDNIVRNRSGEGAPVAANVDPPNKVDPVAEAVRHTPPDDAPVE